MRLAYQIQQEQDEVKANIDSIVLLAQSENRDPTVEETRIINAGFAKIDLLEQQVRAARQIEAERRETLITDQDKKQLDSMRSSDPFASANQLTMRRGAPSGSSPWNAAETKQVTMFVKGLLLGDDRLVRNAMGGASNPDGGFLVPAPLAARIVELRDRRGVARRYAEVVPMSSESLSVPKIAGEISSHYVSENSVIPESKPQLKQIVLAARKLAALIPMSNELNDDALISVADMLARSIAHEFAGREDAALFNGDGTSSFGGIEGLANALEAGSKHIATSRTSFGALTFADFETVVGKAKRYLSGEEPRWFFSREGYYASARRLMNAAGGNDVNSLSMADGEQSFMGFGVTLSDQIHSSLAASTGEIACYFGDMRSAVMMGSRKDLSVRADASVGFAADQIWVRGIERYDIVVHDTGTPTEAGSITALVFG